MPNRGIHVLGDAESMGIWVGDGQGHHEMLVLSHEEYDDLIDYFRSAEPKEDACAVSSSPG